MQTEENNLDIIKKIVNILFLNGEEMSVKEVANILNISVEIINNNIKALEDSLNNIGLKLILNNEKLSINTHSDYSEATKLLIKYNETSDLTPAQLQTITIIAYLESLSTAQISFIRGIQSVQTVRALSTRGLIEKDASKNNTKDNSKDNYILTTEAMQYMGISKNSDLKDFEIIQNKLKIKMEEALNG